MEFFFLSGDKYIPKVNQVGQRLIPRKYPVCIPHLSRGADDVTMQVLPRLGQGVEGIEAALRALAVLFVGFRPRTLELVFCVSREGRRDPRPR